ncbi:glycosyltransferase [Glycomyces sp. TRM65418]|uniref:glycosyltransferase n=1 Tax=Glycomyces sp. TRM65418 TaxID=2867006 RepID=UPI001CE532E9|nr:glycosyltransferase [Glycomyces sp. TRM65418]MCC3765926.1 glycosyltransferase [Glycomyces sp. TRM65418]QZD55508.1 glycosyltransferase [Glycomyces sp. TRM65418]
MRIQIITAGTTGSVAPYTGLGHRLLAEGHEVELVVHAKFAASAGCCGLRTRSMAADPFEALMDVHNRLRDEGRSPGALLRFARAMREAAVSLADEILSAADPKADLILLSSIAAPVGRVVARYHGVASMGVFLQPDAPTAAFSPCLMALRAPSRFNRRRGMAVNAGLDVLSAGVYRHLGRKLGLSGLGGRRMRLEREREQWPIWHGFSPSVVARPKDWRPGLEVAGYWWPHECPAWEPPARLRDFLSSGPPPVFVGFGSMMPGDPERLAGLTERALRMAGLRGVVQSGWAGLTADGDDVITVGSVPHHWLMPQTAAVVHHAGAGTTAAGLRAGVPAVPVPVFTDQPWWAAHLVRMGAAPAALPYRDLTAERLAVALRRATGDSAFARRSAALARRLAQEDGAGTVARAVDEAGV